MLVGGDKEDLGDKYGKRRKVEIEDGFARVPRICLLSSGGHILA